MERSSDSIGQGRSPGKPEVPPPPARRRFLASSAAMAAGLVGGYGAFAAISARFLYPATKDGRAWLFVNEVARMKPGDAIVFRTPGGAPVNVARQGETGGESDFIALSSTCPHLGCQVHWEAQNERFFCPCHNGVFDPSGKGIGGPPGEAGQSLLRYPLRIEKGLLFIEVPTGTLARRARPGGGPEHASGATRPGQDPCLFRSPRTEDA